MEVFQCRSPDSRMIKILRGQPTSEVCDLKPTRVCGFAGRHQSLTKPPVIKEHKVTGITIESINTVDRSLRFSPHYADWQDPHSGRDPNLRDLIKVVKSSP